MNIKVIAVGKLKEKYWRDAIGEYKKRLSVYSKLNIVELKETKLRGENETEERIVIEDEGKKILKEIKQGEYVIALDVKGKKLSSEKLANKISELALTGKSRVDFIIGGSMGLSEEVLRRADMRLSFSDMTFPHQMMRVILLEQIYRSFKINRGETYHK